LIVTTKRAPFQRERLLRLEDRAGFLCRQLNRGYWHEKLDQSMG